eukprot:EC851096.1.p1 GENE.EC851096.1~~EC851096.1.p1  ORF type:complete len:136 (+),score=25.28 EC851096.1:198-605(+)
MSNRVAHLAQQKALRDFYDMQVHQTRDRIHTEQDDMTKYQEETTQRMQRELRLLSILFFFTNLYSSTPSTQNRPRIDGSQKEKGRAHSNASQFLEQSDSGSPVEAGRGVALSRLFFLFIISVHFSLSYVSPDGST